MIPLKRVTASTIDVLTVLLDSADPVWGLQVIKKTGRHAGTVYPILERLERQGWIVSSWEDDAVRSGPRRRFYSFTPEGASAARDTCRDYVAQAARLTRASDGRLVTP